jgi:hypothetical protein
MPGMKGRGGMPGLTLLPGMLVTIVERPKDAVSGETPVPDLGLGTTVEVEEDLDSRNDCDGEAKADDEAEGEELRLTEVMPLTPAFGKGGGEGGDSSMGGNKP